MSIIKALGFPTRDLVVFKSLLVIFVVLLISGCAMPASGPLYSQELSDAPTDKSRVFIYRPSKFFQGGTYPYIHVNGEKFFALRNGGFNYVDLPIGTHKISMEPGLSWTLGLSGLELQITKPETIYLKFVWSEDAGLGSVVPIGSYTTVTIQGAAHLVPVSVVEAKNDLFRMKLSD